MPATESTWRDTKLLHHIFAVSGIVLTIGTLVMFYKDHTRSWKNYQASANNIDLKTIRMRQEQYETNDAILAHQQLAGDLAAAKARSISPELLAQFTSQLDKLNAALADAQSKGHAYSPISVDARYLDRSATRLAELAADAQTKRAAATAAIKQSEEAAARPAPTTAERNQLAELAQAAKEADETATAAEAAAGSLRSEMTGYLQKLVTAARTFEDKALGIRKFKSANIDAAKANLDIAIRDNLPPEELTRREEIVRELMEDSANGFNVLTEIYQSIAAGRKGMESTLKQINEEIDAAQKDYQDALAELDRLQKLYQDQEENYFQLSDQWPFILGKKVTTLPILDAFNSTRKIENLWSDDLEQQYGSFGMVRRFDRCTTCHKGMQKSLPNQPTNPQYVREKHIEYVLIPPVKDSSPQPRRDKYGEPLPLTLADWLGLRLASEGLLESDDATVDLVMPKSPAAKAQVLNPDAASTLLAGLAYREETATYTSVPGGEDLYPTLPGLMIGDVIVGINGQDLFGGDRGPKRVAAMLLTLAQEGRSEGIRLTIRRGLPNPYISHPRLELFLSDGSPHPMQTFACTICHDGQGTGTDFKWTSHTPNDQIQAKQWAEKHGWFDNHHWIFPMNPKRFAESACLKCHHNVVELEASERFPEAPAPKVTHGYHLIRKYGCYGCHEINGFDGPTKRVGPDLRSEPNYFAAAQQIEAELRRAAREQTPQSTAIRAVPAESEKPAANTPVAAPEHATLAEWQSALESLAAHIASHPEDSAKRNELRQAIEDRLPAKAEQRTGLERSLAALANILKDVETPGDLRRPGPSLRFLADKVDPVFLYDWLTDPQHFRPTTRMPRFFGLWDHLQNDQGVMTDPHAPQLEPIEIRGTIEYFASYAQDQQFGFEPRPSGIDAWTNDEKVARGKQQFEVRGCLACHTHKDFPDVSKYRAAREIVQGPDLSAVGLKFAKDRNPSGPDWLYSWIKNPTRYHTRTVMPNLFLDPEMIPGADPMQPLEGAKWFDPADDIATYLLADSVSSWKPIAAAVSAAEEFPKNDPALKQLTLEYLNEAFYKDAAASYFVNGIPPELESELKGAEKDLIVQPGQKLTDKQRLKYIGRKTIAKYGCFGCHDIPGFEDAKPIGTGLADWGRKDPAKLAFEHIAHYIEHGHGHAAHESGTHGPDADEPASHVAGAPAAEALATEETVAAEVIAGEDTPGNLDHDYYRHALLAGNRIGFINQKLKEPRSYDYEKTENKRYNERLRMPQFPFSAEEREAVITFVLGLVAEPPRQKYLFQPDTRNAARLAGRQVLDKYNCGGCHILRVEKWQVSHPPGEFGPQSEAKIFPFLRPYVSPKTLAASVEPDAGNRLHSTLHGLPTLDRNDGRPLLFDPEGSAVESDAEYRPDELKYPIDLYRYAILDGHVYLTGQSPVTVASANLDRRLPAEGGTLTRYLLPVVTRLERLVNSNASGSESYGWLPPPLVGEGSKVQSAWLHNFLIDPYPIRPATFLRMPRFNMSSDEATALVDYFAAVDDAEWPYTFDQARQESRLLAEDAAYRRTLEEAGQPSEPQSPAGLRRLDDALKIVTDGNYCVKCHIVADYSPTGSNRAKAPNLAAVYQRLRPEYVRNWIANPKMILPYTSMPVNIAYDPDDPEFGKFLGTKVSQDLYHGNSIQQVDALVDLLMNYDQFAAGSKQIAGMVKPATAPAEGAAPAAEASSSAEPATSAETSATSTDK